MGFELKDLRLYVSFLMNSPYLWILFVYHCVHGTLSCNLFLGTICGTVCDFVGFFCILKDGDRSLVVFTIMCHLWMLLAFINGKDDTFTSYMFPFYASFRHSWPNLIALIELAYILSICLLSEACLKALQLKRKPNQRLKPQKGVLSV